MGNNIEGFDWADGRHCASQKNVEGGMLIELCLEKDISVSNTW